MKFTAAIFALAAVAIAAPAEIETRSRSTTASECSAHGGVQACCNGLALNCLVQVLGSNCNNNAYCCDSGEAVGGLVNVQALNCAKIL
ncbi:hypothetical protein HRG_009935 [Hirsutella rhossiliensis]|uniref:Hydrophobin 3 n=1 Tax=Hirsutella rhossiliensis TaxID=111463 RepID=A0A9P8MPK6_9HYPO|nr:uncharacterized protein HRG_09935 [Hirsutella rhossiliensis]KAH0958890.1 hypothetical protein HRG_09935 [Hirsutella rhossiliensis]